MSERILAVHQESLSRDEENKYLEIKELKFVTMGLEI